MELPFRRFDSYIRAVVQRGRRRIHRREVVCESGRMAQTVCVLLNEAAPARLSGIAVDRLFPFKHILRARIVLLSGERLTVEEVARQAGVSRPAVWR